MSRAKENLSSKVEPDHPKRATLLGPSKGTIQQALYLPPLKLFWQALGIEVEQTPKHHFARSP